MLFCPKCYFMKCYFDPRYLENHAIYLYCYFVHLFKCPCYYDHRHFCSCSSVRTPYKSVFIFILSECLHFFREITKALQLKVKITKMVFCESTLHVIVQKLSVVWNNFGKFTLLWNFMKATFLQHTVNFTKYFFNEMTVEFLVHSVEIMTIYCHTYLAKISWK